MKPADGKPNYGGRGCYPGQAVKHGTGGSGSGDHRTNGLVLPAKGPPPPPQPHGSNPYRNGIHHPRKMPLLNPDNMVCCFKMIIYYCE